MTTIVTSPVVDTAWLVRAVRADEPIVVVEVTDDASAPGTLAGSVVVDWAALVWHESRRELAGAAVIAGRLADLGIGHGVTVVLAGAPTQFAAYVLWASRVVGLDADLRYLDGGVTALAGIDLSGTPRSAAAPRPAVGGPVPIGRPDPSAIVDRTRLATTPLQASSR